MWKKLRCPTYRRLLQLMASEVPVHGLFILLLFIQAQNITLKTNSSTNQTWQLESKRERQERSQPQRPKVLPSRLYFKISTAFQQRPRLRDTGLTLESLGNTTGSNYSTSHDNRYNLDSYANKMETKSHEDELSTVNAILSGLKNHICQSIQESFTSYNFTFHNQERNAQPCLQDALNLGFLCFILARRAAIFQSE